LLTVKAIECNECGDAIYSRTHHDFRQCNCGNISVGGGLQYFKYDANPASLFKVKKIQIDASIADLYADYESMEDKFGLIPAVKAEDNPIPAIRS